MNGISGNKPAGQPGATPAREEVARGINRAMARFELILSILDQLAFSQVPAPGDSEIRSGCERALTAMLSGLAGLKPASIPVRSPGPEERMALAWLNDRKSRELVDGDRLERFASFIGHLLPAAATDSLP